VARGGAQKVADAMASYLRSLGGEIVTGERIDTLAQLPAARAVLCDVTPRQLLKMTGDTKCLAVFNDVRHELETAGFHTRSHAAP